MRFDPPERDSRAVSVAEGGPGGATACAQHRGNVAVANCERCGVFMCAVCRIDSDGLALCPGCFDRLSAEGQLPSARASYRDYGRMSGTLAVLGDRPGLRGHRGGPGCGLLRDQGPAPEAGDGRDRRSSRNLARHRAGCARGRGLAGDDGPDRQGRLRMERPPRRTLIGKRNGVSTRQRIYRTADALEIEEVEGYDVTRRRVFFDDIVLVTYHQFLGWPFLVALGVLLTFSAFFTVLASLGSRQSGFVVLLLSGPALPDRARPSTRLSGGRGDGLRKAHEGTDSLLVPQAAGAPGLSADLPAGPRAPGARGAPGRGGGAAASGPARPGGLGRPMMRRPCLRLGSRSRTP